jgi:enoyl-CoA hydratase/carnithine racemase
VRAVVLTGAGDAFCAGADFGATGGETFEAREESGFSSSPVEPPAFRVRKPVIAAVNGHAIGIGLTLALQCDIRLVAAEGTYGVVQVRRGVMPDAFSHWTLPRLVGFAAAADVLLTGRTFDGAEALRLGIASRCLPAEDVLPAAMEVARDIAAHAAPVSAALTKRLLWQGLDLGADEVGRLETEYHHHLMAAPDAREGPLAFLERRAPDWQGRVSRDWPENG